MFFYNADGYLRPYRAIETTLEAFEKEFAWNDHRRVLFVRHLEFLRDLKALQLGSFYQWIDGSYVSKKELPGDIDLVTFVNHDQMRLMGSRFSMLKRKYGRWLDVHFALDYPEQHKLHSITLILKDDYHQLYGTTRHLPERRHGRPKGYLQIQFS